VAGDLTKALLVEEVAPPAALGEALFVAVTRGMPLVQTLTETGAVTPEVLSRYLSRSEAPLLRQVVPVPELLERLPPGLCARLFALPVRRDAITGTIDVAVADAADLHPAHEMAYHLGAPVRVVRAPAAAIEDALRRLRARHRPVAPPLEDPNLYDSRRQGPPRSLPPPAHAGHAAHRAHTAHTAPPPPRRSRDTPPWGTPVHAPSQKPPSDAPKSGLGSEIPIPLTRRTFGTERGGTQRPPPMLDPSASPLGEGYPFDPKNLRPVLELQSEPVRATSRPPSVRIPAPGQLPGPLTGPRHGSYRPPPPSGAYAAFVPELPFVDGSGVLAALRAATSRDEVLELLLTGGRMVARKVAIFVAKRAGYLGWTCTPEFGERATLQTVLVPSGAPSILEEAVIEGLYLGPLRPSDANAPLLRVMRTASRDVAAVPVRVSGKTALVVLADELGDTMIATRRLDELAVAAGDALARIVLMRR
jgi:hypothetical protein